MDERARSTALFEAAGSWQQMCPQLWSQWPAAIPPMPYSLKSTDDMTKFSPTLAALAAFLAMAALTTTASADKVKLGWCYTTAWVLQAVHPSLR